MIFMNTAVQESVRREIIWELRASTVIHFKTASNFVKSPGNTSLPRVQGL